MQFGIVFFLLIQCLCVSCMRETPSVCGNGHKLRRLATEPHGWSISTRGLCYLCSDQTERMSEGGKRSRRGKGGISTRNAARSALRYVTNSQVTYGASNILFVEIWCGGRSRIGIAARVKGLTLLRVCAPVSRTRADRLIWRWPHKPDPVAGHAST